MAMSLNDVLSALRTKTAPHVVGISLTIHGQGKPTPLEQAPYIHNIYLGYGALSYFPDSPSPRRPMKFSSEYLFTDKVTVLQNGAIREI